ncbi:MAG: 2-hydroxyhepta-2,4-diene-1,7-dioate isomerase [Methylibium sp. NZG]|nr:MAG: 2-hydroxyhepta-2,4-diene-1,7-dioate isomerase [Methylibium sp. NZG]
MTAGTGAKPASQRWVRFRHDGAVGFGTLVGDTVQVFEGDLFNQPRATGATLRLADVKLLRPVEPSKVIALYNNFRPWLAKLKVERPAEPLYFLKAPNAWLDPGETIPRPTCDTRVCFEGELGLVIGRRAKNVSQAQALAHVFGVTCANDVTAVDVLPRDPSFAQWVRAKGLDGFCPFGPAIATGLDVNSLVLRTTLDGTLRQNFPMTDMLFGPAELVSRLSHDMTLNPGDIILCGTSVGVGVMKPGSTVEIEVEGVGKLVNRLG